MGPYARAQGDVAPVEVIDISGILDERAIDFMVRTIEGSDAQLVVLQLDSAGAISGAIDDLIELMADAPVPVAAWVGPDPAVAYGGVAQVLAAAPIRAAAPGAEVGYLYPTVSGRRAGSEQELAARLPEVPARLIGGKTTVTAPIPGLVDVVVPAIGQLVVGLDGTIVETSGGPRTLATAIAITDDDGNPSLSPAAQVEFTSGGLLDWALRVTISPDAAFFFLVAGLSLVAFEFYSAGVGVMGAVAVLTLLLAGYAMGELPMRWWAVAATLLGLGLYTADFQRNDLGWRSLAGTALLAAGGLWYVDAHPHFSTSWWVVGLVVIGAALFYGIGMTAVVRSRFGTTTIGREHLIGKVGIAADELAPTGVVTVDGARWQAIGPRIGIPAGSDVEITGVRGILLEVALPSDGDGARDDVRD